MKHIDEDRLLRTEEYLRSYEREYGSTPTYRQILSDCGYASLNSVHRDIGELRRRQLISQETGGRGGLTVSTPQYQNGGAVNVQLVGEVHCGEPSDALENIECSMLMPVELTGGKPSFLLRARGTSMTRRGICPGDLLLVNRKFTASNGDIVIVGIDADAAAAKIYHESGGRIWVSSDSLDENAEALYPDIDLDENSRIFGVVVRVVHDPYTAVQ